MRKQFIVLAIAGALSLPLASCAGFNPLSSVVNPIKTTQLYEADLAYDGALETFNKWKDLCARRVIASSCRTYVIQAQRILPRVERARQDVSDFTLRNPTLDATSVISAYTVLVGQFGNTVTTLTVQ